MYYKIKQLEWVVDVDGFQWTSQKNGSHQYTITFYPDNGTYGTVPRVVSGTCPSLELAKEAAQIDYEIRVREHLEHVND